MTLAVNKYDNQIRQEQIRSLFNQSVYLIVGIILLMFGVLYYFWDKEGDNNILLGWFTANFIFLFARAIFVKRFHSTNPKGEQVLIWGKIFALSSLISGVIWGLISVLLLDIHDLRSLVFVSVILSSMISASLVPLSSYIYAYLGFSIPAMMIYIIILIGSSITLNVVLGILFFVSLSVHIGYSIVINRNMYDSFRLRFENIDLLEEVEIEKMEAEKANKDKSRFLTATSHDLRQPLHAMDLYLGALENVLDTDEQHELLDKSRASSKALSELLNAIMDVSRLDAGMVSIEKQNVNLKSLLEEVYHSMQPQAEEQQIVLHLDTPEMTVYSDPVLLGRVIRNLVSNAINHSNGKNIYLVANTVSDGVMLNVKDDGKGISHIEIDNIFSEFYQLNNPERDREKGLGLGLAIVRRIANQLEHKIFVESKVDEGSIFSIELPLIREVDNLRSKDISKESYDLSGKFILIIEDEFGVRDAMRTLLRSWDCEVLVGDSLETINSELDLADYPIPDAIISDYRLRENKTGLDAVIYLRDRFSEKIPAIVITGDTAKEIAKKVTDEQCKLLYKPVKAENLQQVIAEVIS